MINGKKIVDYCTYFDETCQEVLELRIRILNDYVDEFIICESNKTQSGIPIEFKLKQRIKELGLPEEKIRVIELNIPDEDQIEPMDIDYWNCYEGNNQNINSVLSRTRERLQRDAITSVLDDYDNNTCFIVGDIDEIVNPIHLNFLTDLILKEPTKVLMVPLVYLQGRADLRAHDKYNLTPCPWDKALFICTKKHLYFAKPIQIRSFNFNPLEIAYATHDGQVIQDLGWHFSWMGNSNTKLKKRDAFIHYEDKFWWIESGAYDSEEKKKSLQEEAKEGRYAYHSTHSILLRYPTENLPKEIFESKKLQNFFLPGSFPEYDVKSEPEIKFNLPNYSIGKNWQPRIHVVDNFYADPYAVRELALKQEYVENGSRGVRSLDQFVFPGVKEAFEKIIGKKITKWSETYGICGRFQFCTSEDALVYHCDIQRWAGVVYLTPDAPHQTGTSLLVHKKTGIRTNEDPRIGECFIDLGEPYFLDPTPFEEVDVIGNVFNRLVLWDGRSIHAARKYFGNKKENSRLFQIFFFE
jgi:Glycosyltransferase family 17